MQLSRKPRFLVASLMLVLLLGFGLSYSSSRNSTTNALVVYCAHDSIFSEQILRDFERDTGVPVSIRFDTEATKSLGLVNQLIREREQPRCDVFWNNQVLGTIELAGRDMLHPYQGAGFQRIPSAYKDPQARWAGFSGRLRVYIVNTNAMTATDESIQQALTSDVSRMAVAKPMFGTTLSHYTLLWQLQGGSKLREWHHTMRERGVKEVEGNATVKNLVAEGVCNFGWTDTDDFFVAKDEGKPVAMRPVRVDNGLTICIPNCVAIIKGTRRLAAAKRLVDYLLSADTELKLAGSKSRQIPLGSVDENRLSAEVRQLKQWSAQSSDLNTLGPARQACLEWLKSEYLR